MQQPILMQDWVTLRGRGLATAVTFIPHRSRWMWSGDAQAVAVVVEVMELTGTAPGVMTLRLTTAACKNGPWFEVKSWTGPGDDRLYLRRDPPLGADEQFLGYLRWERVESSGAKATGEWKAAFRIVAVEETAD
jgi:hypothetical protein